jgi:hypothetical protein
LSGFILFVEASGVGGCEESICMHRGKWIRPVERIFKKLNRYFCGKWHVGVLDLEVGLWHQVPKISSIGFLKAQNAQGRHILIQPQRDIECYYLLVDDLCRRVVLRVHRYRDGMWKPGRMIIETSPGNYQVWVHSARALPLPEKRYWLRQLSSDPGADPNRRWGRCPGFRNRKQKHCDAEGRYPLAKLVWIDWNKQADIPKAFSPLPLGDVCQCSLFPRTRYWRGNESATDFSYAMALMRRGYSDNEVERCLRKERTNWDNHLGEGRMRRYLDRTIKRAREVVEQQ